MFFFVSICVNTTIQFVLVAALAVGCQINFGSTPICRRSNVANIFANKSILEVCVWPWIWFINITDRGRSFRDANRFYHVFALKYLLLNAFQIQNVTEMFLVINQ